MQIDMYIFPYIVTCVDFFFILLWKWIRMIRVRVHVFPSDLSITQTHRVQYIIQRVPSYVSRIHTKTREFLTILEPFWFLRRRILATSSRQLFDTKCSGRYRILHTYVRNGCKSLMESKDTNIYVRYIVMTSKGQTFGTDLILKFGLEPEVSYCGTHKSFFYGIGTASSRDKLIFTLNQSKQENLLFGFLSH